MTLAVRLSAKGYVCWQVPTSRGRRKRGADRCVERNSETRYDAAVLLRYCDEFTHLCDPPGTEIPSLEALDTLLDATQRVLVVPVGRARRSPRQEGDTW